MAITIKDLSKNLEDYIKENVPEKVILTDTNGNKYELQLDKDLNIILVKI